MASKKVDSEVVTADAPVKPKTPRKPRAKKVPLEVLAPYVELTPEQV
jgi:hypothetical protein